MTATELDHLLTRELERFEHEHPRSLELAEQAKSSLLAGVSMHLYALNRGILMTPFHNMALVSPATTEADVDAHTTVFDEAAQELREC